MPESAEIEEEKITELVEFKKTTVLAAFSSNEGLDSIVGDTVKLVSSFDHDMSTGASRARTASLSAKVAKLKVRLDDLGKDLVSDWKTKAKAVDKSRKRMRDDLDELKVVARKPLTDWEAEQAAIEAARLANEAAEKLALEIAAAEELAGFMDADHDREVQAEAARIEAKRIADEDEATRKAAEAATAEAERLAKEAIAKIESDKQEAIQAANDAKEKAEQAERDKIAAQERAKVEAENAEKARLKAVEQAKKDAAEAAENARLAQVKRQEDEAARVEAERVAREKNTKNISKVRGRIKVQLMEFAKIDEETARRVVLAVKKIDGLDITY